MSEIRRRAEGLVDVLEDELCAMSLGIEPEGSNITLRSSDAVVGQHTNGSGNILKERMMHQRFSRTVG